AAARGTPQSAGHVGGSEKRDCAAAADHSSTLLLPKPASPARSAVGTIDFQRGSVVAARTQPRSSELGSLGTKFPAWVTTWRSVHFRGCAWPSAKRRKQDLLW